MIDIMDTKVLEFIGKFYNHSKTYKVGLNNLKNNYQKYSGIYYTDNEFIEIIKTFGIKININETCNLTENRKALWGQGGLLTK